MNSMFARAHAFNQPLSFVTSSVTDMTAMFTFAYSFNQPLSFVTSKVTDMSGMFYNAKAFNQPLFFNTSKVTNMNRMFYFQDANSLSNANKLLIRCAWAGTLAFEQAGYDLLWG